MKIKGIVPILISISVALGLFIFTYVQFPTTNIFRILGQGFGSLVVGSIVYLVAAFIAKLIYAILGAGSKQKLDIKNINHNANYLAETENQLSEGSIAIAQKFKQDDLSQIRSNDGKELIEGAIENNKYVDECREEAIHQDKKIILEEGRPYLKYRPHNCPYCDSTNIGESMIQAVKDEKERKILGYSYLWEGRCADWHSSWFSVEGVKQVFGQKEPNQVEEKMTISIEKEKNYCYKCGRKLTPEMEFCPKCGHKL